MSNSPLVSYTKISPHKNSPRNSKIDMVAIHCVAGDLSLQTLGQVFQDRQASSNYGVDSKGKIGMFVEEKDRSWCTSSSAVDNRAVTIEVCNDSGGPEWHVSDAAMAALIELLADICLRNNIPELRWKADKSLVGHIEKQNMAVHRWFAAKACPGDFLYERHAAIAEAVNAKLKGAMTNVIKDTPTEPTVFEPYQVTIAVKALNIRMGPGTDYAVTRVLSNDRNTYTIVDEKPGPGATMWCKLKSGVGWVAKDYIKRK